VSDHGGFFPGVKIEMYAWPLATAITIHRANPARCFALIHQTRFNRRIDPFKELQCATWTANPSHFVPPF
jgi:hypothetical protein